nr:lantibiotic dehydratase C-terminal domain-containing protein [Streptomyces sp. SID4948]
MSAHVFTAHPLDLVLSRLVPAVVDDARRRGLADRFFFIRHWQSGPHLRLRLRAAAPDAEPELRALLETNAAEFFGSLSPATPMTARQYGELAARLAVMEPGTEAGRLAPNDSLAFIPYRPETAKYGRGPALSAAEACFCLCSEQALAAATDSPTQRLAYCFALLAGTARPAGQPAAWRTPLRVEQYRRRRASLLPVARAARAAANGRATADTGQDPLARWFAAFRRARDLSAAPDRLADHLSHLACNRRGVRLDQEATLRGLAALAVDELTGGPDGRPADRADADTDTDTDSRDADRDAAGQ